jgi:hypothetical protein
LQELGRKKEALEAYHEILNLYPKNSEMWKKTQMNRSIQINMAELSKDYIKNQKLGNEKNILFDIKDLYSKNKQKESSKDRTINMNL